MGAPRELVSSALCVLLVYAELREFSLIHHPLCLTSHIFTKQCIHTYRVAPGAQCGPHHSVWMFVITHMDLWIIVSAMICLIMAILLVFKNNFGVISSSLHKRQRHSEPVCMYS